MDQNQANINLLYQIARQEYGEVNPLLRRLGDDVVRLYQGEWPEYEACQVGYHDLSHATDVALAIARMTAGWNKTEPSRIDEPDFLCGIAAGFFHDIGYIKGKGDSAGSGGKYSFTHVSRGSVMARKYLEAIPWPPEAVEEVVRYIGFTEYDYAEPSSGKVDDNDAPGEVVGRMVVAADLVAQMADVQYMQRIPLLFDELQEGYEYEGVDSLVARGVTIFRSARQMIDGTKKFYDEFVVPQLRSTGNLDNYLAAFFGSNRNPYQESIIANLSGSIEQGRYHWQQLDNILTERGTVTKEQVAAAVKYFGRYADGFDSGEASSAIDVGKQLLDLLNKRYSTDQLSETLMKMAALEPVDLCESLQYQVLPPSLLETLSKQELIFLLKVSLLLHNYQKGSRVLVHILNMTNQFIGSEASSILLADPENGEMVIALPTGPYRKEIEGHRLPIDKGVSGWVYSHGKSVIVNNVSKDERFHGGIDKQIQFQTRSIIAVPLHINDEWIGVLELLNKHNDDFTNHDTELLICLVNIISSALANALSMHYPNNEPAAE